MKKILSTFSFFLLTATSFAQTNEGQLLERLDSIVCDNGEIARFTYDEQFRIVTKNTSLGDKLVKKEVSEYAEDGSLLNYCAYEERDGVLVPVKKNTTTFIPADGAGSQKELVFADSVYVDELQKLVVRASEVLTYDENGRLVACCTKEYDLKSDGKSFKWHDFYYDDNIIEEVIGNPDFQCKYSREYKDDQLYVITRYDYRDGQWVIQESTVREYYESGALKNEYSYDYSGIIFYMKSYTVYDENGEKQKTQEKQQMYSYKYTRDEKGRVKEAQKYLADSETLVERETYHYDLLPIDSAYYVLRYASDAAEPYSKCYYIPNLIVDGKMGGEYSVYEKVSADGFWVDLMAEGNSLSHSYADKNIDAQYEVSDEGVTLYDYTVVIPTDYGKLVKKEEKRSMDKSLTITSEEEVYYDKSLKGAFIAGLEEDYKVMRVVSRDAKGDEVRGTYFYSSLVETTSLAGMPLRSSEESAVYNLNGQQLRSPQKGINIIGAKKVIVNR